MANVNKELKAFGKSKAELGAILNSVSSRMDKNHPSSNKGYNSLKSLEAGMASLSKRDDAKETFGVKFNV
jgi:hypothetical protein